MNIDRTNYEQYFLDYLDGNLGENQAYDLFVFLSANPDLEEELMSLKDNVITLEPEDVYFEKKDKLLKRKNDLIISDNNIEELLIAKLEKDLSSVDEAQVNKYMDLNPETQKAFALIEKTVLKPDLSIRFDNKQSLKRYVVKKQNSKSWLYYVSSAAAAVILLLFSVGILNNQNNDLLKTNTHILPIALNKPTHIKSDNNKNDFAVVGVEKPGIVSNSVNRNERSNETHNKNNEVVNIKQAVFINDMVKNIKTFSNNDNLAAVNHNVFKNINNTTANNISENHLINKNIKSIISEPDAICMISGEIHTNEFLYKLLEQLDVPQNNNKTKTNDNKKVTLWDIADFGVNSYNKITGKKISINREVDKNGKVKTLAINSKKFSISRSK